MYYVGRVRRIIDRIISVSEAAAIVGVTPDTMREHIERDQERPPAERRLPSARNMGRDWAMLQADVEAFARIPRRPGRPPSNEKARVRLRRHRTL